MRFSTPRQSQKTTADLASEIRLLIQAKLGVHADLVDGDLIASGVLDSLTLIQLLVELESHFDVTIPLQDLEIDSVRTVASLARTVAKSEFACAAVTQTARTRQSSNGAGEL